MNTATPEIYARTGLTRRDRCRHDLPEQHAAAILGVEMRSLLRDVQALHRVDRNGLVVCLTTCKRKLVVSFNETHIDAALISGELEWHVCRLDPVAERRENARIAAVVGIMNPIHIGQTVQRNRTAHAESLAA